MDAGPCKLCGGPAAKTIAATLRKGSPEAQSASCRSFSSLSQFSKIGLKLGPISIGGAPLESALSACGSESMRYNAPP